MGGVGDPRDNPLLQALHSYKKGVASPPVVQNSGSVSPFGDLAVKKKIPSGNVSSPTAPPAQNGGTSDLTGNPLPEPTQLQQLQQQANTQSAQDGQGFRQSVLTDPKPVTPTFNTTDDEYDPNYENPIKKYTLGANAAFNSKLGDLTDAASTLFKMSKGQSVGGLDDKIASGLDWATNYLKGTEKDNPLPDSVPGQIVGGLAKTIPAVLGAYATGGGSLEGEGAELAGHYLTKSDIVQTALEKAANPITKYMAGEGALTGASTAAKQNNGQVLPTLLGGLKGAGEGVQSGILLSGSMGAGEQLGGKLFGLAKKLGVTNSDGVITEQALKSIIGTPVSFAATDAVDDVAHGRPINLEKSAIQGLTALPFEAGHLAESVGKLGDIQAQKDVLDKAIQTTGTNKVLNFISASPEDIQQAVARLGSADELQIQALGKGVEAQKAKTLQDKNTAHVDQLNLQQHADIKGVVNSIVDDKNGFIKSVEASDLQPEDKQQLIEKANQVHQQYDPIEQRKTQLGRKVSSVDADLQKLQPIAGSATDPVKKAETEVAIENLTKIKEEAYNQLKGVISDQHEQLQSTANQPAEVPAIPEEPTVSTQSAPAEGERGEVEANDGKENQPIVPKIQAETPEPVQNEGNQAQINNEQLNQTENENTKNAESDQTGQASSEESKTGREEGDNELEQKSGNVKAKIIDNDLIQPSKLKGSGYHLALAKLPNGDHAIIDTNSGMVIFKPYEDAASARLAYSKSREKLTPKLIEDAKAKLEMDDSGKTKVAPLSPDAKAKVDAAIAPHGITYDQIKDYEQSRGTGLPANDRPEPASVPQDLQQSGDDKGANTNENTGSEKLRQEPGEQPNTSKEQQLRGNLEKAKSELSKAVKKSQKQTNIGVNPELLKSMAKVIKAYADLGIHKFSEIVKDWVGTYKDTTDEDVDALKDAYAAHVTNLEPGERKPYNNLKELDAFMANRKESGASLPAYTPRTEPRLPIPKEEGETEEPQLRKSYSKLSQLKSYAIRNLEQLKAFSKDIKDFDAYREVRKYATSKSQASVILKTATKGITDLIGKEGWQKMREALVESRLRGIKQRWNDYADQAPAMSNEQTKNAFNDGENGNMYDLVKNLQPLQGEQNPAKFAVSLIASGRYEDARNYLSDVCKQAADNVLSLGIPFDDIVKDGEFVDPKMQQALGIYKNLLGKPIQESHASNEGIFSDSLGDLDTYYPLTGENSDKARLVAKGKPFNEPNNIDNRFATGQSDNYSTAVDDLSKKLTSSIKNNNKANALDALKKVGLISEVPHNAPDTQQMQVGNDVWDFVKEKVADERTIVQDGSIINTPSKYVMMPTWLKSELDPVFNSTDEFDKYSAVGKVMNVVTKIALGGPTEAVAHSYRMLGVITNSVPFMQEWAYKNGILGDAGGYVANNPFVKKWTGLFKILNTDISSDRALRTIQEMSKLGIIPEKTWTKTWSREFAELNGAKASRIKLGKLDVPNLIDFGPILYGKNSVDLKARVLMYNLTKAMNPDATPEQHVKMQNELGVYTKALQSTVERKIKESGLAPYYTFGSSVYRTALKSVFGANPLPTSGAGQFARYKAAQLLTNGVIGSVASWALVYHSQTGNWPWEDEGSKLGRLPFPEALKNDLTAKYFTDANGNYKDINMMAINNPIVEKGMRVIGAEKAYETNQLGGGTGNTAESAGTQALNTVVSPFTSSPALQLGMTAVFGTAPYVTSLRDDRGKPMPQLYPKTKALGYGMQQLANGYSAFKSINPLVNTGINEANKYTGMEKSLFGLNSVTTPDTQNEGASSLGFILNMAFPRFFVPHGNDKIKADHIQKSEKAVEKTVEKEQEKEDE